MISIEAAKNQEDLFLIKAAIMSQQLESIGGRRGVTEILNLAYETYQSKDFQKSLKILEPMMEIFKEQPFVSGTDVEFVSISDEMEWALCQHYYEENSNCQVKNIHMVCPVEFVWQQYSLSALELKDFDKAMEATLNAVKWNPASAKYKLMLALVHNDANERDKSLEYIVSAMKCAYKPVDLVYSFQLLRDYFIYKELYNEAMYSSFLRSHFTSSSTVLRDIVHDMVSLIKNDKFNYQDLNDEGLLKTCETYGISPCFNPEVLAVAQRNYEDAFLAKDMGRADYFAQIMDVMKTEQEKRNAARLRRFFEHRRNIIS